MGNIRFNYPSIIGSKTTNYNGEFQWDVDLGYKKSVTSNPEIIDSISSVPEILKVHEVWRIKLSQSLGSIDGYDSEGNLISKPAKDAPVGTWLRWSGCIRAFEVTNETDGIPTGNSPDLVSTAYTGIRGWINHSMRSAKDGDSRELTINQDWNCFSYDIVVPDVYNDVWTTCVDGTCNNGSTACTAETGYFDYACVINPYVTAFEAGKVGSYDTPYEFHVKNFSLKEIHVGESEDEDLTYYIETYPYHGRLTDDDDVDICSTCSGGEYVNYNMNLRSNTDGDNNIKYWPDSNYNGPDSFRYYIKDNDPITPLRSLDVSNWPCGNNYSTVNITINPVNDPPEILGLASAEYAQSTSLLAYNPQDPEVTESFSFQIEEGSSYSDNPSILLLDFDMKIENCLFEDYLILLQYLLGSVF